MSAESFPAGHWSTVGSMDAKVGIRGDVARVSRVTENPARIYLEYPNGNQATVDGAEPLSWPVGTVVLVNAQEDYIEQAPDDLWPEERWVGVVRLRRDDVTVVDASGRLRLIETNDVQYRVGNTIEGRDSLGIVRVLDEKPIRYLDVPGVDDAVVESFRATSSGSESFEDFGGLAQIVTRARELIELPLEHHEALSQIGARPIKGVLFTGPPGTGKTMLARIIANQAGAEFYEISGPEVFSKWYGESEELLRRIFKHASAQSRSIIFFDEIDSVAGQRAGDAHEASRRVVAQLLTLMDGFEHDQNVVVIAATNRPQDIDVALRRPGRFDWEIDFPLPARIDREQILAVTAAKLKTHGPLPHELIAGKTDAWSAAELAAIWSEAALLAVADGRSEIMAEDYVGGYTRVAAQRQRIAGDAPRAVAA